jgi:hypothetical protein
MHDARDFASRLTQETRQLAGAREIGVQLFVLSP